MRGLLLLLVRIRILDDRKRQCFSARSFLTGLANRFVQHDAHRVGEVQAPDRTTHRNRKASLRMLLENAERHAFGFAPKYEATIRPIWSVEVAQCCLRGEVEA